MPQPAGVRRKRRLVALVAAAVVVVGVLAVLQLWPRDSSTPIGVAEAVDRYADRATPEPDTTKPTEPAAEADATTSATAEPTASAELQPGVYVYATTGYEAVDALGGTRHEYAAETAITVEATDCGYQYRWEPLQERYEHLDVCRDGGDIVMIGYTTYHRFYSQDTLLAYTCDPVIVLVPAAASPGETSEASCTTGKELESYSVTVESVGSHDVDGAAVDAVTLTIATELTTPDDSVDGETSATLTLARDTGLILGWSESSTSLADSLVGKVAFEESFELELTSLLPAA